MVRVGRVKVASELILTFLQFGFEGTLLNVMYDPFGGSVEFLIEHPEMPEKKEGDSVAEVTLQYCTYEDGFGHKVSIRQPITEKNVWSGITKPVSPEEVCAMRGELEICHSQRLID